MMKTRLIPVTFSISVLLLFHAVLVHAQSQSGTVSILPRPISVSQEPDNFSFGRTFIPTTPQTSFLYQTLDPSVPEQILEVVDEDPSFGFLITASVDDFESSTGDELIHYTDLSFVTLSSGTDEVDGDPTNNPPGEGDTVTDQYCNWDPQSGVTLGDACDGDMVAFNEPPANSTTLAGDITPASTTIDVADGTQLSDPDGNNTRWVIINGDIIDYTDLVGNQLTGVTGIDENHFTGDTVTQYYKTSQQIDILTNTTTTQTGRYSVGFGFRLQFDENTPPATYASTITFTLMLQP